MNIGTGLGIGFRQGRGSFVIGEPPPSGTQYLQMDGVDDYLKMSNTNLDSIEIDCMIETTRSIILDARAGLVNGYLNSFAFGAGWTLVQMDGSTITSFPQVPLSQRVVITATAASSFTDDVNFFSNTSNATPQKGRIYKITCKLAGVVVAMYDMTLGNVQDQSGNGRHATLSGGTWV